MSAERPHPPTDQPTARLGSFRLDELRQAMPVTHNPTTSGLSKPEYLDQLAIDGLVHGIKCETPPLAPFTQPPAAST